MAACLNPGNPFLIRSDAFEAAKPAFPLASSYWRRVCFGSGMARTGRLNTGEEKWSGKSEDSFSETHLDKRNHRPRNNRRKGENIHLQLMLRLAGS